LDGRKVVNEMGQVLEQRPTVVDVSDATFEQMVVEESKTRPVVVDLWAEWCGPCKSLGPILEKVAGERGGQFLLAKLDVDTNPSTAQAFGVQSIPTVVAFKDGQPVNGFVGAYPEPAVNEFVDSILPSDAEVEVEEAKAEELEGDVEGAEQAYRDALVEDPENRDARVGLARILVQRGLLDEAKELIAPVLPDAAAERVASAIRVRTWSDEQGTDELADAKRLASAEQWEPALAKMLSLVRERPDAREAMIDVFNVLSDDDALVLEYRRKLASALF
jgi:putative thioredoxin